MSLKELQEKLAAKRAELSAIFESHTLPTGDLRGMEQAVLEDIRARNAELADLSAKADEARTLDVIRRENADAREEAARQQLNRPVPVFASKIVADADALDRRSLGAQFATSGEFKEFVSSGGARAMRPFGLEMKTTMTTSAGFVQEDERTGRVVLTGVRPVRLLDLMPHTATSIDTPRWMEETTFTNNSAPVAEGAAKPESALAYTERSQACEVIATTLPVTEQQLDVASMIQSMIDNRLRVQLDLAREDQYLNGDGVSPNLLGYLNKGGIQTQAKGADSVPVAIRKAITKVRWTGFANPTAIVMHPNDMQDLRTLQDSTGNFIFGSPAGAEGTPIWGMTAVETSLIAENTALIGDFAMYSEAFDRWGVRLDVGFVNDDFSRNKRTLRIEVRECLAIYRASAFCTVTGI